MSSAIHAQTTRSWTGATGGAWLTPANWTGSIWAGTAPLANPTGEGTSTDIMTVAEANTASNIGINMSTLAAATGVGLSLGGIDFNKTNTTSLVIGNSSTTVNGILQLNGATINSVANTLIRVAGAANLTIQNVNSGSTSQTMGLRLGITNGIFDVATSRSLTISSIVSQSTTGSGFTKTGAGNLILSAANTYTGGIALNEGVLVARNATALGSGTVSMGGGTLQFDTTAGMNIANAITTSVASQINVSNVAVTLSGPITISGNTTFKGQGGSANRFILTNPDAITSANNSSVTFSLDYTQNHTVSGNISLGSGSLSKGSTATLSLSGTNSYTGGTFVTGGTLIVSKPEALPGFGSAGKVSVTGVGSRLTLPIGGTSGFSSTQFQDFQTQNNSGFGEGSILRLDVAAGTFTPSSGLGNGGIANADLRHIEKQGPGTIVLNTSSAFTGNFSFVGGTGVDRGIARLVHAEGLGPASAVKSVVLGGDNRSTAILELAGNISVDANKSINTAGKSFFNIGDNGAGTPVFLRNASENNSWLGNILITAGGGAYSIESNSGTLTLGLDSSTASVLRNDVPATTRVFDFRGAGDIVLNSRLVPNSTGLTSMAKFGTGTLTISRTDNDFASTPNLGVGTTVVENLANSGTTSSLGSGTAINIGGVLRHVGTLASSTNRAIGIIGASATLDSSGIGTLGFASPTTVAYQSASSVTVAQFALGATTVTAVDVWNLLPGMTVTGTGITAGTKIQSINYDTRIITLDTATSAAATTSSSLGFTGASDLDRTLTLRGSNTGDNTFSSPLVNPSGAGKLSITKADAGKWILAGNNTYTGNTLVSAGTLLVSGVLGNSNTTVSDEATISGNGTIGGSLTLDAGANLLFSLTDTLTVNGATVSFGGFSITNLIGLDSTVANGTYTLIDGTADFGTFANVSNFGLSNAFDLGGGKSAYFESGSLNVVVIPEPNAVLLGGLGLLALIRRRRASI